MLIATGKRRVMAAGMFIIGLVLLWAGISSRLARRELRNAELAALNYPIRVANFWGREATAARETYFDKFLEHKNWRNNRRFELTTGAITSFSATNTGFTFTTAEGQLTTHSHFTDGISGKSEA